MTFEQLEYFIAVAEQDTFFDAAELLHISQSALSKQIMKLERELNVELLDRSRRSASLNPAGEEFYREALVLHRQYLRMRSKMERYEENSHVLRVGTLPILSQYGLTELFSEFSKKNPKIRLVLEEVEETALMQGFMNGRYDYVAARESLLDDAIHEMYPLALDELVAVLPDSHPLALAVRQSQGQKYLSLEQLEGEGFLLMHRYTSIYRKCIQMFEAAGIAPRILRCARPESVLSGVAVGEGVGLLPKSCLEVFFHKNVTAVPLSPAVPLRVVLAKRRGEKDSEAMKRLASCFCSGEFKGNERMHSQGIASTENRPYTDTIQGS